MGANASHVAQPGKTATLALAAPVAQPTQTGVKSVQETTTDDGVIGLLLSGYASRFGEVDLQGEVMQPQAFRDIKSEWGAAARPPVYYNHGFDDAIGLRQIGECTRYKVENVGLWAQVFLPREPDLRRFDGAALHRYRVVYSGGSTGPYNRWTRAVPRCYKADGRKQPCSGRCVSTPSRTS